MRTKYKILLTILVITGVVLLSKMVGVTTLFSSNSFNNGGGGAVKN
jgi:hypothetical protein